jgi:signal transduction histidine kinase
VIGAAKIVRNITEHKKIERALRTTEKLAAAGRLAATVAHEINNPLEAVTNLVFLATREAKDSAKVARYLQLASRELDRVAHIARQTLGFYRDTSAPTTFSITRTLDDVLFLYEKRLEGRKIQATKQYEGDIEITAFAGEIRQALSNLISNSIDAMPDGGSLFIRASRSRSWLDCRQQGVRVIIGDTGSGIPPQYRKSLFQPFFTTKLDVGTGLGLWITHSIVQKHRGAIRVKSRTRPDAHGTAFSIFLPFEQKPDDADASPQSNVSGKTVVSSGVAHQ